MGRGKLQLQLINNMKARCRYFERRKKSVDKAAKELSTLCGIEIGMVIYSPDLHGGCLTTPTTWSSQPGALARLIASFLATGPHIKTCNASDFLKEEKMEEEEEEGKIDDHRALVEEGKLDRAPEEDECNLVLRAPEEEECKLDDHRAPEEEECNLDYRAPEDEDKLERAMEKDECNLDHRAGLVANVGVNLMNGDQTSSLNFTEEPSSGPVLDQEMWTYEQLSAANFDCYSDPATMIDYGGDLDSFDMSLFAEPPLSTSSPFNADTSLGSSYDFVSEFLDMESCFSSSGGQSISQEANWFLNEEQSGDRRFISPVVLGF